MRAFFIIVILLPGILWAQEITLSNESNVFSLLEYSEFRKASTAQSLSAVSVVNQPKEYYSGLEPVAGVDRIHGGQFWYYARIINNSDMKRWVLNPYDAVIDRVLVNVYRQNGEVVSKRSGYLEPFRYNLHYGIYIDIEPGEEVELLASIESRYFSSEPRFEFVTEPEYIKRITIENTLLYACLGAIVILSIYNFFVGFLLRDKSYIYYSLYLIVSVFAWFAAFNGLSQWFDVTSYYFLLPPFFLAITFNALYIVHFLELAETRKRLCALCYALVAWTVLMFAMLPLFSMGVYLVIFGTTSFVWICLGLYAGIVRFRDGFKPARYFIAAFSVVFIGMMVSILPVWGFKLTDGFNHHIISLLAQTIDIVLLSIALADRIRQIRHQREAALEKAYSAQQQAASMEHEANIKLQNALALSKRESKRKSDFLRMVSHELRTPLHSIISSIEQWQEDDETGAGQGELKRYISYGASRLRTQIDNLVLLAETDAANAYPNEYQFELKPVIDRLIYNLTGLYTSEVILSVEISEQVPLVINSDPYLLEHLIRVVMENACKYTDQGQVILRISWDSTDKLLVIRVIDSGCGITKEQLSDVFNDFIQVSKGLDRDSEGLGLGLTICYRLCEILSANFKIDSEPGLGTEVKIEVPVVAVDTQVPVEQIEVATIPKKKILVVEDNPVNATVLKRMLENFHCEVDLVYSGQQALELLSEKAFDTILMDIQMPVMDGITATRWLRRRGVKAPVIAVTANSDQLVRRRAIEIGINDILVKPVRRADIERVLSRQIKH